MNEKKESSSGHLTPSSPMVQMNQSHGNVSPLALDVTSPQTPQGGATGLSRRNSNPEDTGEVDLPFKEYAPEAPIEDLVRDTAAAYHRGQDKANEWLAKLKNQDIMTVGDLRDLQDSDWAGFELTVFESRARRNRLFVKNTKRPSTMPTDDGN